MRRAVNGQKKAPYRGPLPLVLVPIVVTPDDHVSIVVVPTAVPAAIMSIEFSARTTIVMVAVIAVVAADIDAKPLRVGYRRCCNCKAR